MPDPLRILNAIILNDRRERQSDKEMALTAAMFKIKQGNAELDRLNDLMLQSATMAKESKKEYDKVVREFTDVAGILPAVKEASNGISTDADALVGLTQSSLAGKAKVFQDRIMESLDVAKSYDEKKAELQGRIGEYHIGAGRAAALVFDKYDADKSGTVDQSEIKTALGELAKDPKFGSMVGHSTFLQGLNEGLQEQAMNAAKLKTEKASAISKTDSKNYEEFYKHKLVYESQYIAPIKQISDEIEIESRQMLPNKEKLDRLVEERKELQSTAKQAGETLFPSLPDIKPKKTRNYRLQYLREKESMSGLGLPSSVIDKLAKVKVAVEEGLVEMDPKRKKAMEYLSSKNKKLSEANIKYVMDQM